MVNDQEMWQAEKILDERLYKGITQFLVRWEGFTPADDSWEPEENLENISHMIEEFRHRKAETKQGITRPTTGRRRVKKRG